MSHRHYESSLVDDATPHSSDDACLSRASSNGSSPGTRLVRSMTGSARGTLLTVLACATAIAACLLLDRRAAIAAYLSAFLFCLGLSLGALANLMLHEVTGGRWGLQLRQPLLAAAHLMPLNALLFIPILLCLGELYPWARGDTTSAFQHSWFALPFFISRSIAYLVLWTVLTWRWQILSERYVEARPPALRKLSALGLIIYGLTISLATLDWVMSLLPQWRSTTFGLLIGTSQMMSAAALAVGVHSRSTDTNPSALNDFGNLLLMYVMTAAYLAFTQFLIIWAEDLPHEIAWYQPRVQTSWQWLTLLVLLMNFAAPFVLLLFRSIKRSASSLSRLAACVLIGQMLFCAYLIAPTLAPHGIQLNIGGVTVFVAVLVVWGAAFVLALRKLGRSGLPVSEAGS